MCDLDIKNQLTTLSDMVSKYLLYTNQVPPEDAKELAEWRMNTAVMRLKLDKFLGGVCYNHDIKL